MLTALLIVIGVVVSCSQPTIDKPSIEEPTNPNIQNIINELNRLQNIVYEGNTITSNATARDIDNFYDCIVNVPSDSSIDINIYLAVWECVNLQYESKKEELHNLQTPPMEWTDEQKTQYNNRITDLLKIDNNTSYVSLNEKIAKITEIKNKIAGNINPEESSLTIGGVLVENGVVNLTDTNNFEVIKKGDISIAELTININPTKPSELNIKKLYELVQKLISYGITPVINTNDEVTYTINGGDEYIYDEVEYYNTLGGNDLREMGNLNTNKLEIKATFMSGYVTDRIITAKNNAKIKITGNYLDIGENTFIAEDTSSYLLAETVKLTNYNDYYEELWDSKPAYLHYKSISQVTCKE